MQKKAEQGTKEQGTKEQGTKEQGRKVKRTKVKMGIKKKLLGTLLPIVFLVIGVVLSMIYIRTSSIVLTQSERILETSTESVSNKVEAWMNKIITALEWERDAISYFDLQEDDALIPYLKHTTNQYDAFPAGIYIATTEGELKHASFVPGADFDVFAKPWYQEGIESEDFVFGSVYFDEDSQSYVVGASGMLKDQQGKVRGVAAADIYLTAISDIVKEVQLEQTGAMFLVDKKTNTIIGHKEADLVGTTLSESENAMYQYIETLLKQNETGLQIFENEKKEQIYIDIVPIPDSNWITVSYVPHTEVMASLNSLAVQSVGITIVGILLLILFMERLIHIIVKPVRKITNAIITVSEGDFSKDITIKSNDEIGLMAKELSEFVLRMRGMIGKIKGNSDQLSKRAVVSTEVSSNLAQISTTQSVSMEEMNRTVDELAHSISSVAESVNELSLLVANTTQQGEEANEKMQSTVTISEKGRNDMEQIQASMNQITSKMKTLDESVNKVGSSIVEINAIVDLIRDIADETTLLSLNASIEAARAGESGRGFAVVADQIGKLATTSKTAVEDIANLTTNIQKLVEKTVQETNEGVEAIDASAKVVDTTEATFQEIYQLVYATNLAVTDIIEKIHRVNDVAVNVAAITEEQSASAEEILATVEGLNSASKQVLEDSQKVEEDAKALGGTSLELEEQMSHFQI